MLPPSAVSLTPGLATAMHPSAGKRGLDLLRDPALKKGTAFSQEERRSLQPEGLLLHQVKSLALQVRRCWDASCAASWPTTRWQCCRSLPPPSWGL